MRNDYGTAILASVSLFHLCTVDLGLLESLGATYTDLLFHLTMVSLFLMVIIYLSFLLWCNYQADFLSACELK